MVEKGYYTASHGRSREKDSAEMIEDKRLLSLDGKTVKDYYRLVEEYDWVEATDRLRGPESFLHRRREKVILGLLRKYAPGGRCLDLGCGTGLVLRHLPPGSLGLDLNPRNLAKLTRHAPLAAGILGDAEEVPFADGSFSTVICTEVLEHLPQPSRAVAEIKRVLEPGGLLIGSVPQRSPLWRLRFLSSTCPRQEPFHHNYRPAELLRLLSPLKLVEMDFFFLRMGIVFVAANSG